MKSVIQCFDSVGLCEMICGNGKCQEEYPQPGEQRDAVELKCKCVIKPHIYLEDATQILVYNKMLQIDGYGAK